MFAKMLILGQFILNLIEWTSFDLAYKYNVIAEWQPM